MIATELVSASTVRLAVTFIVSLHLSSPRRLLSGDRSYDKLSRSRWRLGRRVEGQGNR